MRMRVLPLHLGLLLASFFHYSSAYIPAQPVNDTTSIVNSSDTIHLAWQGAELSASVSRQLVADPTDDDGQFTNETSPIISWSKYAKGVLVHFSEAQTPQPPSDVPWIALVSCDTNGTNFSLIDDIFTLGRDRGAQAAVLYSTTSEGCLINEDYLLNFEKPLDVYATRDKQDARIIESQYNTTNVDNSAYFFNSALLNSSANAIALLLNQDSLYIQGDFTLSSVGTDSSSPSDTSISTSASSATPGAITSGLTIYLNKRDGSSTPPASSTTSKATKVVTTTASSSPTLTPARYLAAVLAASNMTVGQPPTNGTSPTSASSASGSNTGNSNTGLAMIILYAITGVVTFLFLCVILSGAIRAIRHPERYGPRSGQIQGGQHGGAGQSRAGGLTRAILDTFPVIKFGGRTGDDESQAHKTVDVELGNVVSTNGENDDTESGIKKSNREAGDEEEEELAPPERRQSASSSSFVSSTSVPLPPLSTVTLPPTSETPTTPPAPDVNPADVDHVTTCPICVCEFEDGEDIRMLPCDARHQFHQSCIDPWLLQVSSLCPLCRLDLSGRDKSVPAGPAATTEEDEAAAEQQVLSNLRAMLRTGNGHQRDATNVTSGSGSGAGAASRFLNFVAIRRRQAGRNRSEGPSGASGT